MTTNHLQHAQKRALQYCYVDGTFEFSFGGVCLWQHLCQNPNVQSDGGDNEK